MPIPKIVFFGTSDFSAVVLKKLVEADFKPILLVTTLDEPVGRKQVLTPPPTKVFAQKFGIPVLQPEKFDQATNHKLQTTTPDLFIVASYGKILPQEILDIPKYGALNVHPSLLPLYRGSSPVQTAILNGDEETGVTIMIMDKEVDHGPVLMQKEVHISKLKFQNEQEKPAYPELHDKLAEIGANLLVETIPLWLSKKIKPIEQDHAKATFTKRFKREDGRINWQKSAEDIERQVRAFTPWPGTFTEIKNQKSKIKSQLLKILKVGVLKTDNKFKRKLGEVFLTKDNKIAIQAGDNALCVEQLQLEGSKPTIGRDFLLGHKDIVGAILF